MHPHDLVEPGLTVAPGGHRGVVSDHVVGPQQALLGYMFRNAAPASAVLSFSVGMQFAITVTYATLGGIAIMLTVVSLNVLGDALRDAFDPHSKIRIRG